VSEMHVENVGKEQHFTIRYLAVYAKIADRWQMPPGSRPRCRTPSPRTHAATTA